MELTLLVILLVFVILLNNKFGDVKQLIQQQKDEISRLRADFRAFQLVPPPPAPGPEPAVSEAPTAEPPTEWYRLDERGFPLRVEEEPLPAPTPEPARIPEPEPEPILAATPTPEPVEMPLIPVMQTPPPVRPVPAEPQPSFFQRFLKENPDLEKFIGENLMNKIGIGILVLGIGYFVKFAIDQEWINEIGRVLIGILSGGLLIGVAHRIRRSFAAFSSVLVGGGLAVLYFTITIAFHEYGIFSQSAAFALMVVITAFSILLSISYNRVELAVLSLVGGFATPFMVSTGAGDYRVLLTYILMLDLGMLVLAYFRKWNLVHIVAYGFTVLIFGGWLASIEGTPNAPYVGALVYGTLFYAVFMAMNIIHNLKNKTKFSALEISLLLSNTFFYFGAGMVILSQLGQGAYQGLFTVALGVLNFALAAVLYRREAVDRTLIYLLIGLVITFVSLAVPVQLDGNFITMFWALEAVLLLWLAQKSGLRLVSSASVVVLGLMLISLFMDWADLYSTTSVPPLSLLLNEAFITSLLAIAGLVGTRRLLTRQETPISFWLGQLDPVVYRRILGFLTGAVIYLAGALELDYQLVNAYGFGPNRTILTGCYNLAFVVGLMLSARRSPSPTQFRNAAALGIVAILLYILNFSPEVMRLLSDYYLNTEPSLIGFPVHYLSLLLVAGILVLIVRNRERLGTLPPFVRRAWPWFLGFTVVYIASSELFQHLIYLNFSGTRTPGVALSPVRQAAAYDQFDALLTQTNKVGLPILWGLCAFLFMWVGLNRRNRDLRILSLSLFALTLAKLFLYDIQGISEGGKIAAFISLGVILLIISFMYQKIKKLLLADTPNQPLA
ncbi:DUF2339 domain-containing protein [Larkinella soli]|uniref:DUF2339 domain-containing protein n=1 Tax=Larkinella soli TaxID=1770527 RepID=UPI000FFBB2E0|nr:DUF2339 domain-containing protein [Larkinella soli]